MFIRGQCHLQPLQHHVKATPVHYLQHRWRGKEKAWWKTWNSVSFSANWRSKLGRNPPKLRALNNNYVVLDSRLITLKKIYRVYPEFSRLNNVVVVKVPFFYNLFFSILFVTSLKTIYFKLENYLPLKYKWQCTWTEPPLSLFVSVFKSQVAKSHWKSGFKLSLLSLLCSAEV